MSTSRGLCVFLALAMTASASELFPSVFNDPDFSTAVASTYAGYFTSWLTADAGPLFSQLDLYSSGVGAHLSSDIAEVFDQLSTFTGDGEHFLSMFQSVIYADGVGNVGTASLSGMPGLTYDQATALTVFPAKQPNITGSFPLTESLQASIPVLTATSVSHTAAMDTALLASSAAATDSPSPGQRNAGQRCKITPAALALAALGYAALV